jgi:hypothetical protein
MFQTMQTCRACGRAFEPYPVIDGIRLDLRGRQRCLDCLPLRRLRGPRKPVDRPRKEKICENCGASFPTRLVIDGVVRNLNGRRFCLECSPFGAHNTSRTPPGSLEPAELDEYRRKKRNAKTYRYQKRRRKEVKQELIAARGGRCVDCGYSGVSTVLDFHHRDPTAKDFSISSFGGAYSRLLVEVEKCDLLCANCHRLRHAAQDAAQLVVHPVVAARRRTKARAVAHMGGRCEGCKRTGPPALFDFHHRDASTKDFAVSQDGIPRSWPRVVAELAKCVMLCANCHREVHAGVRSIAGIESGLAEDALPYAA